MASHSGDNLEQLNINLSRSEVRVKTLICYDGLVI